METDTMSEAQLQIKFVTRQLMYGIPDVPYSVPKNVESKALNKLVNTVIRENSSDILKDIDFDFLVSGELLRVPLVEHLLERNVSLEVTVEVEYIERTPPPEPEEALLHDDWVPSVQVNDKWVLTGCYDNTVNIWNLKGKHEVALNHHTNVIRGVSWLKKDNPHNGFVSVSHDLTGILWQWTPGTEPQPNVILKGHERGIDAVAVNSEATRLISGGWDTNLKIWNASLSQSEESMEEPPLKKSKGLQVRTPLHTLKGHKEAISSCEWTDSYTVCTGSMDHTIKFWDVELCGIKSEIVGQKAFLGVSWSPLNNLLITSSADRHIRLYDPRSSEGSVCKSTYTSHKLWVSSVKWSNYNEHLFISGGYDKCVKFWDTRSPKAPLFDLSGHIDKVLSVDWTNQNFIASGGSDNRVHIFKNKHT